MQLKSPLSRFTLDTYAFRWQDEKVDIVIDRIHEGRSGDLNAEIEVRCSRDLPDALLHYARFNLVSTTSRNSIIKALCARIPDTEIDWGAAIEMVVFKSLKHWREGDPVVDLRTVAPREGDRFLLKPYVEFGGPTIIFGDGSAGKSMFCMGIGVSIASGQTVLGTHPLLPSPVLYLDWESDAETHAERMGAICVGAGIDMERVPMYYRRQAASLAESAVHLRRTIAELHIGLVIVDSMGAARGGEPESAETTIRLFNAARTLGVPWIGIDHVTKNGGEKQTKPFGSVFTPNLARLTWGMEKIEDTGDGQVIIALSNHKTNNGRHLGRRGYTVEFREDDKGGVTSVSYEETNVRDVPAMLPSLGQKEQLIAVLEHNHDAMTVEDIQICLAADGVQVKPEQIRTILNRHKDRFVSLSDGRKVRWGLLIRETR